MRIAIVGAGITGLTLAYLLEQRGHTVEVFEAGRAPGGELATVDVGGEPVERFYHHLFTHDRFMIELCQELGIDDRLLWHEPLMGYYAGGRVYPFTSPLDLLRCGHLSLPARVRLGLGDGPATAPPQLRRVRGPDGGRGDAALQPAAKASRRSSSRCCGPSSTATGKACPWPGCGPA